jgi:GNAT superfamily N-acetyltransferase
MIRLTRENKPEVVELLTLAFYDYPVMRYVLSSKGAEYDTQVRDLIGFFCEARFAKEGYVIGIRQDDSLIAAGLIDDTEQKRWHDMELQQKNLRAAIGAEAYSRLEAYETVSSQAEPQAPHYFVGMLGVHPDHQGKGYSRQILEATREMSVRDRRSTGICLSTEDRKNVEFYEHFGYRIIAEMKIDKLRSWCMFLPTLPHTIL